MGSIYSTFVGNWGGGAGVSQLEKEGEVSEMRI